MTINKHHFEFAKLMNEISVYTHNWKCMVGVNDALDFLFFLMGGLLHHIRVDIISQIQCKAIHLA